MRHSLCIVAALTALFLSPTVRFAAAAGVSSATSSRVSPSSRGETFVVEPFRNANDIASLSYLCVGLPAFVAERLAHVHPLRFVGPPTLLGRDASAEVRWRLSGEFSRAHERVTVRVTVEPLAVDSVAVQASRAGGRDEIPQLTLAAAVEAFAKVLGGAILTEKTVSAPFARDPYAFILYSRGIGAHLGLHTRDNAQETARKWLVRALRIDPRSAETMRYLGLVELASGGTDRARTYWMSALDVRPSYVAALADLARLDANAKRPSAVERYRRLVELDPEDVEAHRTYGQLLADAGENERAKAELARVLTVSPNDLAARRSLAAVLAASGSNAELIENLEGIVRLDDGLAVRLDLAAAYASAGRLADAEAAYDDILRSKPRQPTVLKFAGDLAFARGDHGKAIAYFRRMRSLAPSDPRPPFRLGAVYVATGDLRLAERWFCEGAHYPGMVGAAYANLGAVALQRGDTKEALRLLTRATKHRPKVVTARFNLALALLSDNRPAEAMEQLTVAEKLASDDAGVRFFIGVVALRLQAFDEAERAFREALRLDPKSLDAAHNLSVLRSIRRPPREAMLRFPERLQAQ